MLPLTGARTGGTVWRGRRRRWRWEQRTGRCPGGWPACARHGPRPPPGPGSRRRATPTRRRPLSPGGSGARPMACARARRGTPEAARATSRRTPRPSPTAASGATSTPGPRRATCRRAASGCPSASTRTAAPSPGGPGDLRAAPRRGAGHPGRVRATRPTCAPRLVARAAGARSGATTGTGRSRSSLRRGRRGVPPRLRAGAADGAAGVPAGGRRQRRRRRHARAHLRRARGRGPARVVGAARRGPLVRGQRARHGARRDQVPHQARARREAPRGGRRRAPGGHPQGPQPRRPRRAPRLRRQVRGRARAGRARVALPVPGHAGPRPGAAQAPRPGGEEGARARGGPREDGAHGRPRAGLDRRHGRPRRARRPLRPPAHRAGLRRGQELRVPLPPRVHPEEAPGGHLLPAFRATAPLCGPRPGMPAKATPMPQALAAARNQKREACGSKAVTCEPTSPANEPCGAIGAVCPVEIPLPCGKK